MQQSFNMEQSNYSIQSLKDTKSTVSTNAIKCSEMSFHPRRLPQIVQGHSSQILHLTSKLKRILQVNELRIQLNV